MRFCEQVKHCYVWHTFSQERDELQAYKKIYCAVHCRKMWYGVMLFILLFPGFIYPIDVFNFVLLDQRLQISSELHQVHLELGIAGSRC